MHSFLFLCTVLFLHYCTICSAQSESTASPTTTKDNDIPTLPAPDPNNLKGLTYPYRVCSLSTHGDLFRFSAEYECPSYVQDQRHQEGILLVFKENIIPYTFSIRTYAKIVTTVTVYAGYKYKAITNIYEESFPVEEYETEMIDKRYQCYNSAAVNKNGAYQEYVDRDGKNETVNLNPAPGISSSVYRYQSQPIVWSDQGSIWTYRRRTTVNCMVTDVLAKSNSPYNFFASTTGQTVEMSPFYNGNNTEPFNERHSNFIVKENYTIRQFNEQNEVPKLQRRAFLKKPTFSVSWELKEKSAHCLLAFWKLFTKSIKTETSQSFHFLAPQATASFVTPTTNVTLPAKYKCIESIIQEKFKEELEAVSETHEKDGEHQYFEATGGLILVWQPLLQKSLISIKNLTDAIEITGTSAPSTARRRKRRNTEEDNVKTIDSAAVLQIQFAYDRLRDQINQMLGDISRAWCLDQRRSNMILNELTKINPTTVMSSIYGVPVAAKRLGDIISVSKCINIDPSSVSLQKSMVIENTGLCYSRPHVSFRFYNDQNTYEGQLGANNEIILTKNMIENCAENAVHYFQSGNEIHVYSKYVHTKTIKLNDINTLQTFITLNTSLIENIDFKALEIYTRDERRMANVFDIESMLREYNFQTQNIIGMRRDLDNEISNNRNDFIDAMGDILQSLGTVGIAIANGISVVAGFFGSLISGFISFFKNPFGGFIILLIVGGVIAVVVLIVLKTRRITNSPVQMIYPAIEKIAQNAPKDDVTPISKKELDAIMLALYHQSKEQLAATQEKSILNGWFKKEKDATKTIKDSLNLRQRFSSGPKYKRLPTIDEESV